MKIYSHSRLSTFENCRLRYKFAYIDKIRRGEDSIEAFLGQRFHDAMEKVYAERAFWKPSASDLKDFFNELWDKNWGDHVFVTRSDRKPQDYREIGLKAIEGYHRRYVPFDEGRVLGTERRIEAALDETGDHRVMGYIDRLVETEDGHFEIHDYKTSGSLPDQKKLDSDRQLALYEIAVRQSWPDVKTMDLVWHYVVFDKEMRSRRTPEQLDELKASTIGLIDEVESAKEYPPHETNLCRWCDYQNICPLFAHAARTEELPAKKFLEDDGVKLVNQLGELDAKKSALKAEIAGIEEEEGAILEHAIDLAARQGVSRFVGSDRALTIKEETEVEYPDKKSPDRADFEARLKEMGLWEKVSGFVAMTFKSLVRKSWAQEGIPGSVATYVKLKPVKKAKLSRRKDEDSVM
ncbi:MAG: PD-(D/E)XK nuclease family protein [Pseudomonadota bacterium]